MLNIHYIEYIIIQIYYFQTHLLYFNGIYKFKGIKDENGTVSETTNSSQPKESFAEIGVYFQSLNKKLVYEEPKYTVSFSFDALVESLIENKKFKICYCLDIEFLHLFLL